MSIVGYQVSITLHRDQRYAIITSMPGAVSKTLPADLLDEFLLDVASAPSVETLRGWYERIGAKP